MAHYVNIFMSYKDTPSSLALIFEELLKIKLRKIEGEEYIFYEFVGQDGAGFSIGKHDLERDGDLNFEDYEYQIEFGAPGIFGGEERRQKSYEFARFVFDKIKSTNKYSIMLVDDVQKKLDEFKPI